MKTSTRKKWFLPALLLTGLLLGLWFFLDKKRNWREDYVETDDRSLLIMRKEHQNSKTIVNGTAFDKAEVDLGDIKSVVVSHNAIVKQMDGISKMQIYTAKTLCFFGHLSQPNQLTIHGARLNMGCATSREDDTMIIGTYGEWSSIEGGAWIDLIIVLPSGISVEKKKGLSGPDSSLHKVDDEYVITPKDRVHGFWYGPASPLIGWTIVPSVPDMERTAYQKLR